LLAALRQVTVAAPMPRNWKLHAVAKKAADLKFMVRCVPQLFGPATLKIAFSSTAGDAI